MVLNGDEKTVVFMKPPSRDGCFKDRIIILQFTMSFDPVFWSWLTLLVPGDGNTFLSEALENTYVGPLLGHFDTLSLNRTPLSCTYSLFRLHHFFAPGKH